MEVRIDKPYQCSECGSQNIMKPANDNQVWELECGDCGHKKIKTHHVNNIRAWHFESENTCEKF